MTEKDAQLIEVAPWYVRGVLVAELAIGIETPSNNLIKGMHFQAYKQLRGQWRQLVESAFVTDMPRAPLQRAFLAVTRECAGGGLDWDNAYGGLKPLLDCLVKPSLRNPDGLGVIEDDSPRHMPYPPYLQQLPAKPGNGKTTVKIYALTE